MGPNNIFLATLNFQNGENLVFRLVDGEWKEGSYLDISNIPDEEVAVLGSGEESEEFESSDGGFAVTISTNAGEGSFPNNVVPPELVGNIVSRYLKTMGNCPENLIFWHVTPPAGGFDQFLKELEEKQ